MAASNADVARLRRLVNEPDATTYTDADLRGYIERYPLIDGVGHEPYVESSTSPVVLEANEDWTATYDLNSAAADVWMEKAAALAGNYDFSAGGQSFQRSQAYQQYLYQVRYFRSRRSMKTVRQWPAPRPDEDEDVFGDSDLSN
jgi:hypothetical protein